MPTRHAPTVGFHALLLARSLSIASIKTLAKTFLSILFPSRTAFAEIARACAVSMCVQPVCSSDCASAASEISPVRPKSMRSKVTEIASASGLETAWLAIPKRCERFAVGRLGG